MSDTTDRVADEQTRARDDDAHEVQVVPQHIVEFVSDSGEGAQTAGQLFGTVSAKMGNGVWTVEIIPAEIEPPNRSRAGASGNRIRIATEPVTNMGEAADVVVAFNEQVPYSRIDVGALREGTAIFLENKWSADPDETIRKDYAEAVADFRKRGYKVIEVPMEQECLVHVEDARRGKNVWALGLLCHVYERDLEKAEAELRSKLARKGEAVVGANLKLLSSGYEWARKNVPFRFRVPVRASDVPMVVMNGNQAVALGIMAAGIEVCAMYPITPATSVSHYLAAALHKCGGFLHQAEDEIAAIGFALGASYAGKTAATVTSGPGLALKTEFLGLAVMAELPLVLVVVQRGDPSTGLPTRVEQGDLLAAVFGAPGDAPKVVIAPSNIEECFHYIITARKLAETFRGPVIVLTDASLATAQQPFPRPTMKEEWLAPPIDQSDWDPKVPPYAWNAETGFSSRPIPGQRGGTYVLTGLAHDEESRVAYESAINQRGMEMRSRKLATIQRSLKPPKIHGDPRGDLLIVGWGSTRGAIEEAVDRVRAKGGKVSSVNLRFLSPLEPGLKEIFSGFKQVVTIEINYSDPLDAPNITEENRRISELAMLLRAKTLVDIDSYSRVPGVPLSPGLIERELRRRLKMD
jgi:2-oxoglutarate ferredoxin oxidoreductase subunit alpha